MADCGNGRATSTTLELGTGAVQGIKKQPQPNGGQCVALSARAPPSQPFAQPMADSLRYPAAPFLFLDIDGVLLPFGDGVTDVGTHEFPRRCLDALAQIVAACAPQVVLSSTWRCDRHAVEIIRQQFVTYGEPLSLVPLDVCTDPTIHSERQWEIAAWLQAESKRGVDVSRWCVLDDMDCVLGKANQRYRAMFEGRCVLVESSVGLAPSDVESAIAILTGSLSHAPPRSRAARGRRQRRADTHTECNGHRLKRVAEG